eukprot:PhF_6_TR21005/c1_g1_i2/m.30169
MDHCYDLLLSFCACFGIRVLRKKSWLYAVHRCYFPGVAIRYHMSMVLPMTLLCVVSTKSLWIIGIVYVLVLVLFHASVLNSLRCVLPSTESSCPENKLSWVLAARGSWIPRTSVAMGGPFFSSYLPLGENRWGHIIPHAW